MWRLLRMFSFSHWPNIHWFLQPDVMATYLLGTGTLGWIVWWGSGIPRSWGFPPNFYPPHMGVGLPLPCLHTFLCISMSLPLLLVWMNRTSLNPWLLDCHTAWFSDDSFWYLFCSLVVIFAVVVQGVMLCLPRLLSWPEDLLKHIWTLTICKNCLIFGDERAPFSCSLLSYCCLIW